MSRRSHHRKNKEIPELDIVTFFNWMVVLIPFLLISAVFSRITVLELDVPTAAGAGDKNNKPKLILEVIVREKGLEIGNGKGVVASFKKEDDKYDVAKLSRYLKKIKENFPDKTDAIVLMEPDIEYEYLVLVMDAVRSADPPEPEEGQEASNEKTILFTDISLGDAP